MRALRVLAAAVAMTMIGPPSGADTVCRPTELGTLRCAGPAVRPEPRPVYRSDVQALDRVRQAGEAADRDVDRFVPARETEPARRRHDQRPPGRRPLPPRPPRQPPLPLSAIAPTPPRVNRPLPRTPHAYAWCMGCA